MMGGSRGRAHRVRPGVDHARGVGPGGGGIGIVDPATDISRVLAAHGGVRKSLAQLRADAELARANAPSLARYVIWSLAIASGQSFSEIERVRVKDAPYLMDLLKTRKVPDGIS